MHVQNITTTHTELVLIFFLAQNQMEMVNKRTMPLAVTKHLTVTSDLLGVAHLFHSGGSHCPRCLSLAEKFLISFKLSGQATSLSLTKTTTLDYRNLPSWQSQTPLKNTTSIFWQTTYFFSIFQYLFFITEDFLRNPGQFRAREEGRRRITSNISPVFSGK